MYDICKTFCKDNDIRAPLGNCGNINDPLAKYSLEPDSNQWPRDICFDYSNYSLPLYQLSYRGIDTQTLKLKQYNQRQFVPVGYICCY